MTVLNWIGYQMCLRLPFNMGIDASTRLGRWCLVRAGNHAYGP
jgi:hypothetical protein